VVSFPAIQRWNQLGSAPRRLRQPNSNHSRDGTKGFSFSKTNDMILNFKKPVKHRGTPSWRHKNRAIYEVAQAFSQNLGNAFSAITLVPAPPSKLKTDPEYDDRMMAMLKAMRPPAGQKADIRELVIQNSEMPAAHGNENRLPPHE
jgi:hypothetical protein